MGELCREALAGEPAHADAHFLLGVSCVERGRPREALPSFEAAVRLAPERAEYLAQLARCLSGLGRLREASAIASRAVTLRPRDAVTLDTLGVVHSRAQQHAPAADLFRRAVALQPRNPSFLFNLASSLTFLGDFEGAEAAYERALEVEPRLWKAHSAVAQLRRQTPARNHVARLEALLAQAGEVDAQLHVRMALAKELEDLGRFEESFAHLAAGKAAKRATLGYHAGPDAELFAAIRRCWGAVPAAGGAASGPIFVVGMPRTGTTLVERILSSHRDVQSVGESQNFALAVKRAAGTRSPRVLDLETVERAAQCDPGAIGRAYLDATRPAAAARPRFVDKMPLNFLYAGLIARALPEARIVCLRREPRDACLSNFRQLFAVNYSYYDYAWDLLDCGRYYLEFDRLVAHWQDRLPGRILQVRYESLVESQEEATRGLLGFCGLEWDPACLRFEDNAAPVSTASAVQVRSPMYRSSLQRWRRYEPQLQELMALLRAGGIRLDE